MKILWFCNILFSENSISSTGTWLVAMYHELLKTGKIQIVNITTGDISAPKRIDYSNNEQWVIPRQRLNSKGLPSKNIIDFIQKVENEFNPDIIHIWGTESFWGTLQIYSLFKTKVLLDIQGLMGPFAEVFYGGLTNQEIIRCTGIKELLLPKRLLYFKQKNFEKRGLLETKIIKACNYISVQSDWVKQYVTANNPTAKIFDTDIILRSDFYEAAKWTVDNGHNHTLFTTLSGSNTYKGLHVLIKSIAQLRTKYPNILLKIGGNIIYNKFLQDGYSYFLLREIKRLGVHNNVKWLGSLNSHQIIEHLHTTNVFVIPSFVETYCVALAEALYLGVPSVASYAAALPELAEDKKTAYYFPTGDYRTCARKIDALLTNQDISVHFSKNLAQEHNKRNNIATIIAQQIRIYQAVLSP